MPIVSLILLSLAVHALPECDEILARRGPRPGPAVAGFLNLVGVRSPVALRPYETLAEPERQARFIGQNSDLRRLAIETARQDGLWHSREFLRRLESPTLDPATQFYNIVFIGAGSAETTAQLYLAKNNVTAKTITLEADEVVARTFYDTRGFYLNSTDGPSASDDRPLPNLGLNLNKIPNGFTQTSFISGKKYAEAGVLGDVININRLLLPNPIVFNARVANFRPSQAGGRLPRHVVTLRSGRQIYADLVFEAGGLGTERSSAASPDGRAYVEAEWDRFVNGGEIPRYFTATRLFQFIKHQAEPYVPFVGKTITVIGGKDFANVVWELFERSGPPDALKDDSAEIGRYREGCWLAPGIAASCAAFTATSRGRYLMSIPSALQKNRIKPVDGRALDVVRGPLGPRVIYRGQRGLEVQDSDFVIDAVGFERERTSYAAAKDIIADLPGTAGAVVGREVYPGAFQVGVGSGVPVTEAELANNDDNRASLYLNLVRVEATVKYALETYAADFGDYPALGEPAPLRFVRAAPTERLGVRLVNPDAFVQGSIFAGEFVDNAVNVALSRLDPPVDATLKLSIALRPTDDGPEFIVTTPLFNEAPVSAERTRRLVDVLTASPAFFSVLSQFGRRGPVELTWTTARGAPTAITRARRELADWPAVTAWQILRGYRPPAAVRFAKDTGAEVPLPAARPPALRRSVIQAYEQFVNETLRTESRDRFSLGARVLYGVGEAYRGLYGEVLPRESLSREYVKTRRPDPKLRAAIERYLREREVETEPLSQIEIAANAAYDRFVAADARVTAGDAEASDKVLVADLTQKYESKNGPIGPRVLDGEDSFGRRDPLVMAVLAAGFDEPEIGDQTTAELYRRFVLTERRLGQGAAVFAADFNLAKRIIETHTRLFGRAVDRDDILEKFRRDGRRDPDLLRAIESYQSFSERRDVTESPARPARAGGRSVGQAYRQFVTATLGRGEPSAAAARFVKAVNENYRALAGQLDVPLDLATSFLGTGRRDEVLTTAIEKYLVDRYGRRIETPDEKSATVLYDRFLDVTDALLAGRTRVAEDVEYVESVYRILMDLNGRPVEVSRTIDGSDSIGARDPLFSTAIAALRAQRAEVVALRGLGDVEVSRRLVEAVEADVRGEDLSPVRARLILEVSRAYKSLFSTPLDVRAAVNDYVRTGAFDPLVRRAILSFIKQR